jgi:5-methylcytosine-specific restriction endonuclease McrA
MKRCEWCGAAFTPTKRVQRFCTKSCAGRYQWRDQPRVRHNWATSKRPPVDAAHRRLRAALLPLALGTPCPLCGVTITTANAELDHITPRSRGGQSVPSNVRILCGDCNHKRGSRDGAKAANARRQGRGRGAKRTYPGTVTALETPYILMIKVPADG